IGATPPRKMSVTNRLPPTNARRSTGTDEGAGMDGEDAQSRKAEFVEYLRQNRARLFGYVNSLVHDLNHADDLYQQTALILWTKFGEFDRRRSFFSWACGIARLEFASFLRTRRQQPLYFGDHLSLLLAETQEEITDEELEGRREALSRCVEK